MDRLKSCSIAIIGTMLMVTLRGPRQ